MIFELNFCLFLIYKVLEIFQFKDPVRIQLAWLRERIFTIRSEIESLDSDSETELDV